MNKKLLIEKLKLEPHPLECGYFKRTYESKKIGAKHLMSSIYYLLTDDQRISYFHKNSSDIMHYYHQGSVLTYYLIFPSGELQVIKMGANISAGEQLQLLVPAGVLKASFL